MLDALTNFSDRIDRENLRVRRPHQTIFLCGGLIAADPDQKAAISLRDYLVRSQRRKARILADLVLAETAQQLYRDTHYADLISFEEDIARIASLVLVVSESAGSLAELGAFASEEVIRDSLRILMSEEHSIAESFVRYGPVRRIENINRERVGVFPWRIHKANGHIVRSSIQPHYTEMVRWINDHIGHIPESFQYNLIPEKAIFFDILWILSLLEAAPPEPLYEAVRLIHPGMTDFEIRDKFYVLKTCRWIGRFSYGARDYYFLPQSQDPYDYAFKAGERPRDIPAFKLAIAKEFRGDAGVNKAVIRRLQEVRGIPS